MQHIAKTLLAIEIAVIIAAICAVVGSILFFVVAEALGASNMNGGLAMGVANDVAPLIGLIGLGAGAWLGWRAVRRMEAWLAYLLTVIVSVMLAGLIHWGLLWMEDAF